MFDGWFKSDKEQHVNLEIEQELKQLRSQLAAINNAMAVISFKPDGTILDANEIYLSAVGYSLNEIVGKHHRMFCDSNYANSQEYTSFWQTLGKGQQKTGRFERKKKNGESIWIEASYAPVYGENNQIEKIIKCASDITEEVLKAEEQANIIDALNRSMAVIQFLPTGEIITANDNFLKTYGYGLNEIVGQHHRILCDAEHAQSTEYANLWYRLGRGEFITGQFKRMSKNGDAREMEAIYNPIVDKNGVVTKVIKFATDITDKMQSTRKASEIAYATSLDADKSAQKSSGVVSNTINLMGSLSSNISQASTHLDELNKQSDQISNIVNTISSIAEQTNLLALNAAIEAARAGDQGRGFAVVADEVRGLAARTSDSTTEISDVVKRNIELSQLVTQTMQKSIVQVDEGVTLVSNINENISDVNQGVGAIVDAVKQLHSGH